MIEHVSRSRSGIRKTTGNRASKARFSPRIVGQTPLSIRYNVGQMTRPEYAMRRLLQRLLLLCFLVHMVFGCCWHHAHGSTHEAESAGARTGCPCSHHPEPSSDRPDPKPSGHRGCDIQRCVFTRTKSVAVDEPASIDGVAAAHLVWDLCAGGEIDATIPRHQRVGAPVRLHLLNQALLL